MEKNDWKAISIAVALILLGVSIGWLQWGITMLLK